MTVMHYDAKGRFVAWARGASSNPPTGALKAALLINPVFDNDKHAIRDDLIVMMPSYEAVDALCCRGDIYTTASLRGDLGYECDLPGYSRKTLTGVSVNVNPTAGFQTVKFNDIVFTGISSGIYGAFPTGYEVPQGTPKYVSYVVIMWEPLNSTPLMLSLHSLSSGVVIQDNVSISFSCPSTGLSSAL